MSIFLKPKTLTCNNSLILTLRVRYAEQMVVILPWCLVSHRAIYYFVFVFVFYPDFWFSPDQLILC